MTNYFDSPFKGKLLSEQVKNPNIKVGRYSYYSGYYHGHSFDDCARYLFPDRDDVDKLIIGSFCSIGSGASFIMAGNQGHRYDWASSFPFFYMQEENYIKEAKYDMAVGHLLLKSFWANEAVFQMMMLSYNLFLLFKFDSLDSSEYRQQIKTFRLKYVFLAAKIIKTARYVIMKLSENYPYKGVYEKCLV